MLNSFGKHEDSQMSTQFEDIVAGNKAFAENFSSGDVPGKAAKKVLLITCMDCRIVPHRALGYELGDMKIIRNGGGQVHPSTESDAVIANNVLGCDKILVMQHTQCGMAAAKLEPLRELVNQNTGADTSEYNPPLISDQMAVLTADVEKLKNNPMIKPGTVVEGAFYHVETGKIEFI